ncbi:Hypothetical predicted protein, partial [Mytilus galloprovincialis]
MGPSTQATISTPLTTQASTTPTKAQLTTRQSPLYSISATHQAVTSSSSTTSQQPSSSRHRCRNSGHWLELYNNTWVTGESFTNTYDIPNDHIE